MIWYARTYIGQATAAESQSDISHSGTASSSSGSSDNNEPLSSSESWDTLIPLTIDGWSLHIMDYHCSVV